MTSSPTEMEPTEMELRVAEAIKSVDDARLIGTEGRFFFSRSLLRASYLSLARAAIRAMRISTLSMSEAGDKLIDKAYKNGTYEDSEYVWIAMIDAASPQGE